MRRILSACLLICAFSSATIAAPKEDALQVVELWAKSFTAADVEKIVALYAPDAVFMGTGSKTIVTQPEAIRKYFEAALLGNRKWVASLMDDFSRPAKRHHGGRNGFGQARCYN